jgi:hypothetical protein
VRYTCTAIECLAHSRKRKILFRRRSYEHGAIVKVSSVGPVPGHGCIESQRTLASTRSGGVLVGCHRSTPSRKLPDCNPYPDRLLGEIAPSDTEPDAVVVARETIELAFIAAIQLLSPWQRAVLILRDVLNWSASETASVLDTITAVDSALQRARATLHKQPPSHRSKLSTANLCEEERDLVQRFIAAHERGDAAGLAATSNVGTIPNTGHSSLIYFGLRVTRSRRPQPPMLVCFLRLGFLRRFDREMVLIAIENDRKHDL